MHEKIEHSFGEKSRSQPRTSQKSQKVPKQHFHRPCSLDSLFPPVGLACSLIFQFYFFLAVIVGGEGVHFIFSLFCLALRALNEALGMNMLPMPDLLPTLAWLPI